MNPQIPPRPDIPSFMGGVKPPPTPERTTSSASSAAPERTPSSAFTAASKTPSRRDAPPIPPHPVDMDWKEREEIRQRELEEAKARAIQMEKTMRWWSDCTGNWREKWSKVRNERNKSREECRILRAKLESSLKESSSVKRERMELNIEVENLRKQVKTLTVCQNGLTGDGAVRAELERAGSVCSSAESHKSMSSEQGAGSSGGPLASLGSSGGPLPSLSRTDQKEKDMNSANALNQNQEDFVSKLLSRKEKDLESSSSSVSEKSDRRKHRSKGSGGADVSPSVEETILQQQLNQLQLKLQETEKILLLEKESKMQIVTSVECVQEELTALKYQHDEVKRSRQDALDKLTQVSDQQELHVMQMSTDLEDSTDSQQLMDKVVAELRKELERLQSENAAEWGKRERLETEKLTMERDNKRLRAEVGTLQEDIEKRTHQVAAALSVDKNTMQLELDTKIKEMSDLRHSHSKAKKLLQEKTAELEHTKSRTEQYEVEVRKLRSRVDELKQELATAEDECDQQAHQVRKLQRTNDELQQQVENLSVQVQHLHTRLRNQPLMSKHTASLKSYDPESTDVPTTDDDAED